MPKTKTDRAASQPRVVSPLWTTQDVSDYFAGTIATGTLANWRASGKGPPFIKMGERGTEVLYRPAAVQAWAEAQERNSREAA